MVWLCILATTAWGGSLALFNARAQGDVAISAVVPEVEIGPTMSSNSGNSSPLPNQEPASEPITIIDPNTPPITIPSEIPMEKVIVNGHLELRPVFSTRYPHFSGKLLLKNALIFIEVHSASVIRATTYTDENGAWIWNCPEQIEPGAHTISLYIQNGKNPGLTKVASIDFYIAHENTAPQKPSQARSITEPAPGNQGVLFDAIVRIPDQFKTINPGDELIASINLINFGRAGSPVDVGVEYTITDANDKIVVQKSETVAVATRLSLLKSFKINPTAREGSYTLTIRVPSKDIIAVASDTFTVAGKAITILSSTAKIDYTLLFQAILALFFLSFMILYFEYNRIMSLSRTIRQISEFDLKTEM
jgi:hypothetical protein